MNTAIKYINNEILKQASLLNYIVADVAPSTESDLFSSTGLVVWSGASDNTVYQDAIVNYAFRAIHDHAHKLTGLGFTIKHEIELGCIQAAKQSSDLMADLFYYEIAGQALYYKQNGVFVADQLTYMTNKLSLYKV